MSALLMDVLQTLIETVPKLQSRADQSCESLEKLGLRIQRVIQASEAQRGPSEPLIVVALELLKKIRNETLKQLGEICCKSPGKAADCSPLVSNFVAQIKEASAQLMALKASSV